MLMLRFSKTLLESIVAIVLILLILCAGQDDGDMVREESGYDETIMRAEVICDSWEDGCSGAGSNPSNRVFFDNFNGGGQNPDWKLNGWNVASFAGNFALHGVGHSSASVKNHDVKNIGFKAKFKRIRGGMHFSFRSYGQSDGPHRYFVGVDANSLSLSKQLGGNFIQLARTNLNYVNWDEWHNIEIRAIEDKIRVFVDGTRCICYADSDPINSQGEIWLETLDNSDFYIDDVSISK